MTLFPNLVEVPARPTDIIRSAELSDCGQLRWTLTRTWRAGPHVCWIGLNPSTADHMIDDPTVSRWTRFSHAWGYGGFVAVNLYPFRSSKPADLRKWAAWESNGPDWWVRDRMVDNMRLVGREAKRADLVVACWGAGAAWNDDACLLIDAVVEEVMAGDEPWPDIHCLGKTAGGAPIHPMARGVHRVPDDAQPIPYRIQ